MANPNSLWQILIMKNEMVEIRNENRKIFKKLIITQRSIDSQKSIIISLSEELKTVKKEMSIHAEQKRHMDCILETVQSLGQYNQMINLIDNSNTLTNNENILDNNTIIEERIIKTEIQDEIEDISTFNDHDDNSYYNDNLSNMSGNRINGENVLDDIGNNSISNEMTIKTELENPFEENINENLEKAQNNQETNLIEEVNTSNQRRQEVWHSPHQNDASAATALNPDNETPSQFNLFINETSNPQTSNLNTLINIDSEKRKFKCHLCLKAFTNFLNLQNHLRIHTGERPFKCHICTKTFTTNGNMKIHLRIHTGERPFECTYCFKSFTHSSGLNHHLKIHNGEQPFKCHICPKTFLQSAKLQQHLRTHTGEKPFECSQCKKSFISVSNLNEHLRKHREII